MALVDNFDSYSNGDLNGQGSWSGNVAFDVQSSVVQAGLKAIENAGATQTEIYKDFSQASAGSQGFYIRTTNVARDVYVVFSEGASDKIYTWLWNNGSGAGKIGFNPSGGNVQVKTDCVADTWYKVEVEWQSSPSHQIRMRVNDGTWSSWYSPATDWTNGLDRIKLIIGTQSTGTGYWDSFSGLTIYTLTCTEDLSLTDSLIKQISKPLMESLSFADTILKSLSKSFSETISLSDTITKVKLYFKQLTETISLADILQRVTTKVLQEAVTLTDSIVKLYGKTYSEAITLTDTIIKQTNKVFSESITFTDSIIKAIAKAAFTEAVSLADSITKTASRAYSEAVTLTDTIIKHIAKTLTESLTFTDKLKMLKNGVSTAWRKVARTLDHTWRKIPRP